MQHRFQNLLLLSALIAAALWAVFWVSTPDNSTPELFHEAEFKITNENVNEIEPVPPTDKFGFPLDTYRYKEYTVKPNESLYVILRRHELSPKQIFEIQKSSDGVANLSRMVPGQRYRIYFSGAEPVSFVWQSSATKYVTLHWEDQYRVEPGEIPVITRLKEASGIIRSSLYETIYEQDLSGYIGSELAKVFAWQIDFFTLRKGDHFKVIYEELLIEDQPVGFGDIKAAEFQHRGEVYKAYYFENEEREGYFDEQGNSLEKALLKAPFEYSQRVSSGFTHNRFHPILQRNRPHYGTDYAAPTGTPILAVGDGVVTEAQRRGGNGNIVQIRHNGTYSTAYLHLNGFANGIRRGASVKQGQVIGYVGQTGLATGPHLCYRLYVNDRPVNSRRVDLPASESLNEKYLPELNKIVNRYQVLLEEIPLMEEVASIEEKKSVETDEG